MSYKITITNNKNGEVLVNEENAVAIVGAVANKQDIIKIGFTDCDTFKLANAILGAETVISEIKNQAPPVDLLLQLKAMKDKTKANNVVLSREEYQELEDLRINHAKDLINANKSYEEHIKDIKLEYSNHIKNLEETIDRQSKDLNSQANRLIDLKEELENKGKETAKEIISYLVQFEGYANIAGEELAKRFGLDVEE